MTKPALALFTGLTLVAVVAGADVTGNWDVEAQFDDSRLEAGGFDCTFKQDEGHLTGTCSGVPVTGDVKDQSINWEWKSGGDSPATVRFKGTVNQSGTGMNGTFSMADKTGRFIGWKK